MSLKVKLISCLSAFIVVLSLMLISVFAATNVTLNIGGNVSFTASSVNALITGSIAGNAAGGSTLTTIDIDASDPDGPVSMPSDWTSMDLTFTESASPITVTINIQNRSTDREIAVSLTDSTTISNVTVTRECDGTSINASDSRKIPGGETITYTFKLNVQSQNSSANGAFNLTIGLETPGPQTYEYFTFKENEDGQTVTLTDYNPSLSDSTDITIPSTVDVVDGVWQDGATYTVTAIASAVSSSYGIFYNSEITSIELSSTLESIGNYAFKECSKLTSISLPSSLTSIGYNAFDGCSGLTGELNLGGCTSLTSIGSYAFRDCDGLTSISLPSSLTSIGEWAFYCDGLKGELNLGGCTSLTSIGNSVFRDCSGLTSISLPSSLTSIGNYAFDGCNGLTGELDLSNCTSLTSIGDGAFESCSGLTGTVTIPASVTSIGDNPFAECGNIEGIVVEEGNGEYYIEENCLIENSTKTLITGFNNSIIPNDIKVIGGFAFFRCSRLTSMTLPESLISIENNAFGNCVGLTGKLDFSKCTSLTSIENGAFAQCINLKELNLSNCASLKTIEYQTFYNCGFISIILPSNLESIEGNAFGSCGELTSISLPSSLTSIGDSAFSWCSGLTSITLPASLTSIGRNAFSNCSRLTSVTFENTTGWVVSTSSSMTNPISVVVTDSSVNADNLTGQYVAYYWKRNA